MSRSPVSSITFQIRGYDHLLNDRRLRCIIVCVVSYDVNKDGVKVAVLTFTKSAYRLGETVMGVVELNRRASRARVLKVGIIILLCMSRF